MTMRFALEAVYAGKGDALILHHGTVANPKWMLIDGGHRKVYANYLRPRLEELRVEFAAKLDRGKIPLDLVMVSHADADHVQGLLDLKRHLEAENAPLDEPAVSIAKMWVNGFDDLAFGDLSAATDDTKATALSVLGDPGAARSDDIQAWVASTGQCRELRDFAVGPGQIPVNDEFGGGLVRRDCPGHPGPFQLSPGLKMTIIGPDEERIELLRKQWKRDLEKILKKEKSRAESFADSSKHNLASIMVMVERGKKKMLLTGDGRGDHLLEGLDSQGFLRQGRVDVDLFKIPHHGSSRNVETSTFETIVAEHYVISANGEHHNPDIEMLAMLAEGREKAEPNGHYSVHFTFPERAFEAISEADAARRSSLARQREALLAIDEWLSTERPPNFTPVFRQPDRFSVIVDLLAGSRDRSGRSIAGGRVGAPLGDGEQAGDDQDRTGDEQDLVPAALVGQKRGRRGGHGDRSYGRR